MNVVLVMSSLSNIGQFMTGVGTCALALVALGTVLVAGGSYRVQARENRGRWLTELQHRFESHTFRSVRRQLYNGEQSDLMRALGHVRRLNDKTRFDSLTEQERRLLVELDDYLDFFELIGHMIKGKRLKVGDAYSLFAWYVLQGIDQGGAELEGEINANFEGVVDLRKRFNEYHEKLERKRTHRRPAAPGAQAAAPAAAPPTPVAAPATPVAAPAAPGEAEAGARAAEAGARAAEAGARAADAGARAADAGARAAEAGARAADAGAGGADAGLGEGQL
jgi:hypothetical protein